MNIKDQLRKALSLVKGAHLPSDFYKPEMEEVGEILANGFFGLVSLSKDRSYIIKLGDIPRREHRMSKELSKYNFCPTYLSSKQDRNCIKQSVVAGVCWNPTSAIESELVIRRLINLHSLGYFHGDMSPHNKNALIDERKNVSFVDFSFTYKVGEKISKELYIRILEELAFVANYTRIFGMNKASNLYRRIYDSFKTSKTVEILQYLKENLSFISLEKETITTPSINSLLSCYQGDDSHKKYELKEDFEEPPLPMVISTFLPKDGDNFQFLEENDFEIIQDKTRQPEMLEKMSKNRKYYLQDGISISGEILESQQNTFFRKIFDSGTFRN